MKKKAPLIVKTGTELQLMESMADIVRLTFKNANYAAIHNNVRFGKFD